MAGRVDVRATATRIGDAIRALLPGHRQDPWRDLLARGWQPEERELYRTELDGVSVQVAGQQSGPWGPVPCILTNQRLLVPTSRQGVLQLPLTEISTVNPYRHYDSAVGFRYWVALYRRRGDFSDVRGQVCLRCKNPAQTEEVALQIQSAVREATGR
ncbi:MAG: hypothetical protein JOZ41_04205 [Chloroflexi bacterium]|nr:hypothetical protein [Chloroflexota bacterium]